MPQHITVTDYNPAWKEMFKEESAVISEILGDNCIFVHHIGSTSVPGLAANPQIDTFCPSLYPLCHPASLKTAQNDTLPFFL